MNEPEHAVLIAAAEAVTDGLSVDWIGLKSRNPDLRDDLSVMESVAEVAAAYRTWRDSETPHG